MDLYDLITTAPHDVQGPFISFMNNMSIEIKDILQQGIEGITSEVKAQSLRIYKLEDYRRFDDDSVSGLGILRAKFDKLRGSAFANVQAKELMALQEATKIV